MKPTAEFRFTSGRLALDLAATVRRRPSKPKDVLAPVGAPARWLRDAGLAPAPPALLPEQEAALRTLREVIFRLATAATTNASFHAEDVRVLNEFASHPSAAPQLDLTTQTVFLIDDDPFRTAMATIARDAIDLLGGPLRSRIRPCAQPDCGMLFVDASPSGRRRWCSMDRCGSRAKGKLFRKRQKGELHEHTAAKSNISTS